MVGYRRISVDKFVANLKQKHGGSGWGSNPPRTWLMPLNGFEARGAHRDSTAPVELSINHWQHQRNRFEPTH